MKRTPINEITDKFELLSLIGQSTCNYCERNDVESEWSVEDDTLTFISYRYTAGNISQHWQARINEQFTLIETMVEDPSNTFVYTIKIK